MAEVAASLTCETVVNVQGDEPEIDPNVLDCAIEALAHQSDCVVATVASPFTADEDATNPDIVKVVLDQQQRALYFSRSAIPFVRCTTGAPPQMKHIGVYVFRRPFLIQYVMLPATPLETAECLEQLRILEHGHRIAVVVAESHFHGIDTPQQYEAFVQRYRQNTRSG